MEIVGQIWVNNFQQIIAEDEFSACSQGPFNHKIKCNLCLNKIVLGRSSLSKVVLSIKKHCAHSHSMNNY